MQRVYLDNNATTGLDPRVLQAMLPELSSIPSNPSSVHFFGQEAKNRLQKARETIASFFKVRPQEILFTSGGTEALNMLITGAFFDGKKGHLITSTIEHACIYHVAQALEKRGCEVTYLKADLSGHVDPYDVQQAIRPETKLIVLSAANSETGVKNDYVQIATIAEQARIPFVVDGVALVGKELFEIPPGVSAFACSAHKFHGPKGIGCAFIRNTFKCSPLLFGGGQEFSKRAGTENLAGIIGLSKAIELLYTELPSAGLQMGHLRDYFESELQKRIPFIIVNGKGPRVPNVSNLAFPGVDGETLLLNLDLNGIAASHGSACSSGALEPSRVLTNMGIPFAQAKSSLRFSLSRFTTKEEIKQAIAIIERLMQQLNHISL